jgi:hypothetical protein
VGIVSKCPVCGHENKNSLVMAAEAWGSTFAADRKIYVTFCDKCKVAYRE